MWGGWLPPALARALAGSLAIAPLAGCIPGPNVPEIKVDVPGSYRFADAKGGLENHAVDWWTTFHSPELTRFMEETEVGNFSVAAAIGQVEQADAMARQAGAALFPTLSASNSVTRTGSGAGSTSVVSSGPTPSSANTTSTTSGTTTATGSGVSGTGAGSGISSATGSGMGSTFSNSGGTSSGNSVNTTTNNSTSTSSSGASTGGSIISSSFTAAFSATYQLDLWGRFRALYKASQETATADRWNRQEVQLTQLASTATTYFNVLSARERVAFAKQDVTDSSRILTLIQDRQKYGTATALDVAQQAALVANLRASIPPLQVTADQNVIALGILLGRAPQRVFVAGKSVLKSPVPRIAPGLPSEVLTQRPDVEMAESSLAAAHADLVAARAAFFPQLSLTAQGGFESTALSTLFSPASTFYSLGYSLAQPIFDGGSLQGQYDQQKGLQDQLLANYKLAVVTAFSSVDQALVALKLYAEQEELTRQSLEASRLALQLSEDRLKQGVLDVVTLLQTEQTLFTTQDTLVQVRLSRLTEAVTLFQALGGSYAGKVTADGKSTVPGATGSGSTVPGKTKRAS